jgi:arabinofuranosyltransferase
MAVLLAIYFVELIRTAWISDDALITLRTVMNFLSGYGPTFNVDERVQAYTHPLWFLLLSGLAVIVANVYAATFVLSIGVSMLALWLLLSKGAVSAIGGVIAAAALLLSKAFMDFSTSGLENPLSHVALIGSALLGVKASEVKSGRYLTLFFLSCSAIYLTRPDLVLLSLPLAVLVVVSNRHQLRTLGLAIAVGALPTAIWTLFSLYYYGFPFPNTAYAKLGGGTPLAASVIQGGNYFLDSLIRDPLTLTFIALALLLGFRASKVGAALSAGVVLSLVYVIAIGGDFMSGRFFTAPMVLAALLIARAEMSREQVAALAVGVGVLGAVGIDATLLSNSSYSDYSFTPSGIANERGYYYQRQGLAAAKPETFAAPDWRKGDKVVAVICGGLGYEGMNQGPGAYLIDDCALADPLLARLPTKYDPHMKPGHLVRQIPTDYEVSVYEGVNALTDPSTHAYYDVIRLIARGDLGSWERIRAIARMNLGREPKPDTDMYRYANVPRATRFIEVRASARTKIVDSGEWDTRGNFIFSTGLDVLLDREQEITSIDLSVDSNDTYRIDVISDGKPVRVWQIQPSADSGMARHTLKVPAPTPRTSRVRITPSGDGRYSLGHFIAQ